MVFLAWGLGLFAVKIGVDILVARAFGRDYSPLFYVSPLDAPLLQPGKHVEYWLSMWGVALPFILIGLWLTVRRLRDAGAPSWPAFLFFIPFANLIFFVACAALPTRPLPAPAPDYREPPREPAPDRSFLTALILAGAAGAVIALGSSAVSVGLFEEYGAALFLGAPAMSGFFATLVFCRLHAPRVLGILLSTAFALMLSYGAMLAFAMEGAICLVMAAPLATATAAVGAGMGWAAVLIAQDAGGPTRSTPALVVLPLWLLADGLAPQPSQQTYVTETSIVVEASPETVWDDVVAFPELPEPQHPWFRLGVAAPTGAVIEGEGVGAVRRCQFTTGEFVEPIEVWDPPRELGFGVRRQPQPMFEMTPWDIDPPHLDGYFRTTRGRFLLEPVPGERTRVTGETHYELDIAPSPYWRLWADHLVHRIHLRVLRHVRNQAEGRAD
ncbi:MAG: DUF805 domain-containing protein [Polyangiales bacterium]